jgi:hypothetical protein
MLFNFTTYFSLLVLSFSLLVIRYSLFLFPQKSAMPDFTLSVFRSLLLAFRAQGYALQTLSGYLTNPAKRTVILLHNVDRRKNSALDTAHIEATLGIKGTYYFRMGPQSFDPDVVRRIAAMGHEIGYLYEDLAAARGDHQQAIATFKKNLAYLRQLVPVSTMNSCRSPFSRFNNHDLWKHYHYRDFNIIGEPCQDVDPSQLLCMNDAGRKWNVDFRDKGLGIRDEQEHVLKTDWQQQLIYRSTADLIQAVSKKKLPHQVMLTIHPHRWNDRFFPWMEEWVLQRFKNPVRLILGGGDN